LRLSSHCDCDSFEGCEDEEDEGEFFSPNIIEVSLKGDKGAREVVGRTSFFFTGSLRRWCEVHPISKQHEVHKRLHGKYAFTRFQDEFGANSGIVCACGYQSLTLRISPPTTGDSVVRHADFRSLLYCSFAHLRIIILPLQVKCENVCRALLCLLWDSYDEPIS
jgi:hypothetical protein